jgi:hypothetical protein
MDGRPIPTLAVRERAIPCLVKVEQLFQIYERNSLHP